MGANSGDKMSFRLLPKEPEKTVSKPPESEGRRILNAGLETIRQPIRQGVNLAGLAAGLPGDILGLANQYIAGPATEAITGQPALPYEQTTLGKILPPSSTTKAQLQSIAPEFLKPRNKVEEFADTVIEDTALLFSPGKTKIPYARTASQASKFLKPFYISLGANLLGEGVKDFTGGDKAKAGYIKLGAMFLFSLIDKPKAAQYASSLYKKAEDAIPQGAKVDATKLENTANNLKTKMSQGTKAPSEKFIIDESDAILQKIKNGEITVEEAWATKRSLNEKLEKHVFENPDRASKARARKTASQLQHELSNILENYSHKNKAFGETFGPAEEAYATIAKSRFISKFINKNATYNPKTSGLLHAVGSAAGGAAGHALGAGIPGTVGAAIAYPVVKVGYRIAKSPTLRKHYAEVIKAAAAEDAVAFNKELQRLDEAYQHEEGKQKYKLLD